MKIYKSITIALDGTVLQEDSYNYSGPVAACKGGGGGGAVTQVVNVPPKTQQETELDTINLQIAKSQRDQLVIAQAQQDPAAAIEYLSGVKSGATQSGGRFGGLEAFDSNQFRESLGTAKAQIEQNQALLQKVNERLANPTPTKTALTPEEQAQLDQTFASAKARGEEDLLQFGREIAAQRGLRTSDSPIGNELVRERGRLALGLESAKAGAGLDLAQANRNFGESVRQFQEGLRQTAFQNRLSLASTSPLSVNLAGALAAQRFQGISQTQTSTATPSFGQVAGGIGGLLFGTGQAAQGFGFGKRA